MGPFLLRRREVLKGTAFTMVGAALGVLGTTALRQGASGERRTLQPGPASLPRPAGWDVRPTLALSLTVLQEQAERAVQLGRSLSEEQAQLSGMNVLRGFATGRDGELLLLGDRDAALPPTHLDDLAVALRNAYHMGEEYRGAPGVSIDPIPDAKDPWSIQKVRVFGMPRSAMSERMVTIDYKLKSVSAGLMKLVDVPSLYELRRASSGLCNGARSREHNGEMRHRFWFYPRYGDRPRFLEAENCVLILRPVDVQLLTEREFFDRTGRRTGAEPAVAEAEQFVRLVTERVLATGAVREYAHLRSDFRVLEAAKLLRFKQVTPDRLRYLLEAHPQRSVTVPTYVGGIRRTEQGEATCEATITERATSTSTAVGVKERLERYEYRSRGGVEAKLEVVIADFRPERTGHLSKLLAEVRASRPSERAMVWPIPMVA